MASDKVIRARHFISGQLCTIEDYLSKGKYKLTLIARHVDGIDADIIMSNDTHELAMEALRKMEERTKGETGGLVIAKPILAGAGVEAIDECK